MNGGEGGERKGEGEWRRGKKEKQGGQGEVGTPGGGQGDVGKHVQLTSVECRRWLVFNLLQ